MTTANTKTLTLSNPMIYVWTTVFVAANVLFPQVVHLMPLGGKALLPIMLFTLIASVRFGLYAGLLTAALSPLVSYLLCGMPDGAMLTAVYAKSLVIALTFGLWKMSGRAFNLLNMALLIIGVQFFCFVIERTLIFGIPAVWSDLLISWPGMILQLLGGFLVVKYWK